MSAAGMLLGCCSTALSIAVTLGGTLLTFYPAPPPLAATLAALVSELPLAAHTAMSCANTDKSLSDSVPSMPEKSADATAAFSSEISHPIGISATPANVSPGVAHEVASSFSAFPEPLNVPDRGTLSAPIDWLHGKSNGKSILALSGFNNRVAGLLIEGINTSDLPLTEVQGTLKPDKGFSEMKLTLRYRGYHLGARDIPPGTPFSLVYDLPKNENGLPIDVFLATIGGAVFTFKYTLAGQDRTLITYLSYSAIEKQLKGLGESKF